MPGNLASWLAVLVGGRIKLKKRRGHFLGAAFLFGAPKEPPGTWRTWPRFHGREGVRPLGADFGSPSWPCPLAVPGAEVDRGELPHPNLAKCSKLGWGLQLLLNRERG